MHDSMENNSNFIEAGKKIRCIPLTNFNDKNLKSGSSKKEKEKGQSYSNKFVVTTYSQSFLILCFALLGVFL